MILWSHFLKRSLWWLDFNVQILRENKHSDHSVRPYGRTALENSLGLHKKLNTELLHDPVVFHLDAYPRSSKIHITQRIEHKYYSSVIHDSHVDAIQMSSNGGMSTEHFISIA